MTDRIPVLDEIKERTLEDVLLEVARKQQSLSVRLPSGETVAIEPLARLKPLPLLDGCVPNGWKDAVYD